MSAWKTLLEATVMPQEDQNVFSCFEEERAETLSGPRKESIWTEIKSQSG